MTSFSKARLRRVEDELVHVIEVHGLFVYACEPCGGRGCARCSAGIGGFSLASSVPCSARCPLARAASAANEDVAPPARLARRRRDRRARRT